MIIYYVIRDVRRNTKYFSFTMMMFSETFLTRNIGAANLHFHPRRADRLSYLDCQVPQCWTQPVWEISRFVL